MFIGFSPARSFRQSTVESVERALPLAETVIEVPGQVQISRPFSRRAGMEGN
jgi:hypothetical protein